MAAEESPAPLRSWSIVHHVALRTAERLADLPLHKQAQVTAPAPHDRVHRGRSDLSFVENLVVVRVHGVDEVPVHVRIRLW